MKLFLGVLLLLSTACLSARAQLYGPNRAQMINDIFQIPIQTLMAIGNVAQNTRPIGEIVQRRRRPQQQQQPQQVQQYPSVQISRAARVAGLHPAADGSFFRI